jgi:hypothetical protein
MKEFMITQKGFFVEGVEQEVGSRHKFESLPSILVGKAEEVQSEPELEVATPRRGRPPKDQSAE